MKWFVIFLLLLTPAYAGWDESDNPVLSYEQEDFDHSRFYFVKMAVKQALVDAVQKKNEIDMRHEVAINTIRELQTKLITLKANGLPFEYSLYSDMIEANRMLLILIVSYEDEKGKIEWEFDVMSDGTKSFFMSRIYDGIAPESFDDYYVWERLVRE